MGILALVLFFIGLALLVLFCIVSIHTVTDINIETSAIVALFFFAAIAAKFLAM